MARYRADLLYRADDQSYQNKILSNNEIQLQSVSAHFCININEARFFFYLLHALKIISI